ncbi:hypothetical protein [Rhizobium leguminosarum]|uniref:hypothetical protein n=1 Tax=Rhizobium leguminosarum TaxID=384 RepID=UPI00103FB5E6|nr:hypothetical protein [Rhizobium leguminosarum]TBZ94485.1 hypothetical protein E0H63_33635 [Rhizobium leguminosarum bv. viciae]
MAEIVHFPRQPVPPRLVPPTLSVRDHIALQAAIRHLVTASQKLMTGALAHEVREESLAASAAAAEAALFHLLTLKGACNADLPLRRLLVERDRERSKP